MSKRRPIIITDVDQVITALGGLRRAAEWCGYESTSGVSNWKLRGIPPGLHYRIDRRLRLNGYEVQPTVFGYDERECA